MKNEILYSSNQVINAVLEQTGSHKSAFRAAKNIRKEHGTTGSANDAQYSWEQINEALFANGWSPKRLLNLSTNLKNS